MPTVERLRCPQGEQTKRQAWLDGTQRRPGYQWPGNVVGYAIAVLYRIQALLPRTGTRRDERPDGQAWPEGETISPTRLHKPGCIPYWDDYYRNETCVSPDVTYVPVPEPEQFH